MKTVWISSILLIFLAHFCVCKTDEVETLTLDDNIERGKRSGNTDQPHVAKETNGDLGDESLDKRNLGRWRNYRHIVAERGKRYLNRWINLNNWLNYLNRKSEPVEKRGLDLDMLSDHYENNLNSPNDGGYVLSKRNIGRWRNRNYVLSYAVKRSSEEDLLKRMQVGDGGRFHLIQLNNEAIFRLPETISDLGNMKRNVGRWRNWAHRFRLSKKSVHPEEADESSVDLRDVVDDIGSVEIKRNIGRWRNSNYMRQKKPILIDSVASKRFLGRWKNRNFQLNIHKK